MFTGIIKEVGIVKSVSKSGTNLMMTIQSKMSSGLKVDESVCHNGVCLTVVSKNKSSHTVQIISETLEKTKFSLIKKGDQINLEKSLALKDLLSGHLVQGHVDTTAILHSLNNLDGSIELNFKIKKKYLPFIIPQGSICIDGISLTISEIKDKLFKVSIIPYTFNNTNIQYLKLGDLVNIEFDIVGKYLLRFKQLDK